MKLNKFLWDTYIQSKSGKDVIRFFSELKSHYMSGSGQLKLFVSKWEENKLLEKIDSYEFERKKYGVTSAIKDIQDAVKKGYLPRKIRNNTEANEFYKELSELKTDDDENEDLFYPYDIPRLSVALFCFHPEFFFPYYFYRDLYALKKIFNEFGIFLPPLPAKSDFLGRYNYYNELCRSLCTYWDGLGFKREHIPVFLYGFAPEVIDLMPPGLDVLPKPRRAWFVGGGIDNNGDFQLLDRVNSSSNPFWQGNRETETGDIVIMYCLSPRSCIHSIWRATQDGTVEPFFNFYSTVRIGYPQIVKRLSFSEIKADPILSKMPLVKANMQGINGRNIPKEFYDRILFLLKAKGEKISKLPKLENIERSDVKIKNEKDVEKKILEPLLLELGFKSDDWERQVTLRVGRKERAIPDYLIHTRKKDKSKNVSADWVWEAKFSIAGNEQLGKDFEQVCSYARLVGANGVSLISKEGLWIASLKSGLNVEMAKYFSAVQIQQLGIMNELRALAGKKALSK
ncbi:MAG: hypothetical protein ACXVCN_16375 [Bdellovibrio sp.]